MTDERRLIMSDLPTGDDSSDGHGYTHHGSVPRKGIPAQVVAPAQSVATARLAHHDAHATDLDEIETLAAAATCGPWIVMGTGVVSGNIVIGDMHVNTGKPAARVEPDAAFIAAARSAVPAMAAELRQLRALVAAVEADLALDEQAVWKVAYAQQRIIDARAARPEETPTDD